MMSRTRVFDRLGPALSGVLLLVSMIAACGSTASGPSTVGTGVSGGDKEAPAPGPANGTGSEPDGSSRNILYAAGQPDLLIIKTGTLVLQVAGIDAALAGATQQIGALGGYASGSERSGDKESDQATITFRIPAARWDEAQSALRGLASKVLEEHSSTEDVTTQVVDLGARIKNLQATEQALQEIMVRATEIKDVLAVQAELTSVRGQIEELTAQKAHLEAQAAYSTLAVTFSLKPNPVLTSSQKFDPANEVDQASASLVGVLQGLATAGIWFGIVWLPILIAFAIFGAIVLFVGRRVLRVGRRAEVPAAPATPAAGEGS